MNINQQRKTDKARAYSKKMTITDGNKAVYVNANDLMKHLGVSKSHAHKLIKGEAKLTRSNDELLQMKCLGVIPSLPNYYIRPEGIEAPNGYLLKIADMENMSLANRLLSQYEADTKELRKEVERLQALVHWLNMKLAQPVNLQSETGHRVIKGAFGKKKVAQ